MAAADFLVEIGTEELPPKALRSLKDALGDALAERLRENRLEHAGGVSTYASPRRLAVIVSELALAQDDRAKKLKGPPVSIAIGNDGKPTQSGLSFASKCGVDFSALGREKNEKGEWLSYNAIEKGKPAAELLPGIVTDALNAACAGAIMTPSSSGPFTGY
jgi:glycyl-tRNA synthetase beta chain